MIFHPEIYQGRQTFEIVKNKKCNDCAFILEWGISQTPLHKGKLSAKDVQGLLVWPLQSVSALAFTSASGHLPTGTPLLKENQRPHLCSFPLRETFEVT